MPKQFHPSILELVEDWVHVAKVKRLTVDGKDRNEQLSNARGLKFCGMLKSKNGIEVLGRVFMKRWTEIACQQ